VLVLVLVLVLTSDTNPNPSVHACLDPSPITSPVWGAAK